MTNDEIVRKRLIRMLSKNDGPLNGLNGNAANAAIKKQKSQPSVKPEICCRSARVGEPGLSVPRSSHNSASAS